MKQLLSIQLNGQSFAAIGNICLLDCHLTGLLCSRKCQADKILEAYDQFKEWAANPKTTIVSSFHSPVEKESLRLLNKLVTKKRASANPADRQIWDQDDLLFISSFGEQTDSPELAFAHFHHDEGDLPTLRVLGWDGGDTPLKLDQVNRDLHARLCWPDDEADLDEVIESHGGWPDAFAATAQDGAE